MKLTLFRYLIIITSLLVAFFAVKYALANLYYLKVDAYLERWQKSEKLSDAELNDALTASDSMLYLHGHFPHYLNVSAKVYEWKAFKYSADADIYQASLLNALALYQKSIEVRSHWPLTWSAMANIKANLKQFDDAFYYYYDQSIKYGPFMPEVNVELAKIQLRHWRALQGKRTKVGLEQIKRALLNNTSRITLLNYAQSIEKQHIVCTVGRLNKIASVTNNKVCKVS